MTTTKEVPNIILGLTTKAVTVYTSSCEKVWIKNNRVFNYPVSSSNWPGGPKPSKIVDLLRIKKSYLVRGFIDSADEDKFDALCEQGGVFNMNWKSVNFNVNFDKFSMTNSEEGEQDETPILFTVIVGENLG